MLLEEGRFLPEKERERFMADLEEIELRGAEHARPVEGVFELLEWLKERRMPWGVVSRNCRSSILLAAERVGIDLPPVTLSREDAPPKPDPRALWKAADLLGVPRTSCLFVGDFIYDSIGARRAGMRAILIKEGPPEWMEWTDVSYPNMKSFVGSLSSPVPLVPWEYRETASCRGTEWLKKAWQLQVQIPDAKEMDLSSWLIALGSLGVGRFVLPQGRLLEPKLWKRSAGLPKENLGTSLFEVLVSFMNERFPMAKVDEGNGGTPLPSDLGQALRVLEDLLR